MCHRHNLQGHGRKRTGTSGLGLRGELEARAREIFDQIERENRRIDENKEKNHTVAISTAF